LSQRIALGLSYSGQGHHGWQSQPDGRGVQDILERALEQFAQTPLRTLCAGRTDAGVHGLMQVVHFDTELDRPLVSWVRGTNAHLPPEVAVQWAQAVPPEFHARACALTRRYVYVLLESPVRPSLEHGRVGWVFKPLEAQAMQQAAQVLLGTHDFSSFRAAQCQSPTPIKTLHRIQIERCRQTSPLGSHWRFEFEGNAFLHHMIRNIMGCLIWVGQGLKPVEWMAHVLQAKDRDAAAPTFSADGLYFAGPVYDPKWGLPTLNPASDHLPH
jgi:tRNA pseudouridine38-40 synthase